MPKHKKQRTRHILSNQSLEQSEFNLTSMVQTLAAVRVMHFPPKSLFCTVFGCFAVELQHFSSHQQMSSLTR